MGNTTRPGSSNRNPIELDSDDEIEEIEWDLGKPTRNERKMATFDTMFNDEKMRHDLMGNIPMWMSAPEWKKWRYEKNEILFPVQPRWDPRSGAQIFPEDYEEKYFSRWAWNAATEYKYLQQYQEVTWNLRDYFEIDHNDNLKTVLQTVNELLNGRWESDPQWQDSDEEEEGINWKSLMVDWRGNERCIYTDWESIPYQALTTARRLIKKGVTGKWSRRGHETEVAMQDFADHFCIPIEKVRKVMTSNSGLSNEISMRKKRMWVPMDTQHMQPQDEISGRYREGLDNRPRKMKFPSFYPQLINEEKRNAVLSQVHSGVQESKKRKLTWTDQMQQQVDTFWQGLLANRPRKKLKTSEESEVVVAPTQMHNTPEVVVNPLLAAGGAAGVYLTLQNLGVFDNLSDQMEPSW